MTHPNSHANLKLGAAARKTGKIRHHYTILPEHHAWLSSGGHASIRLEEMISKILGGELIGFQHVRKLEAESEKLRQQAQSTREELSRIALIARGKNEHDIADALDLLRSKI